MKIKDTHYLRLSAAGMRRSSLYARIDSVS